MSLYETFPGAPNTQTRRFWLTMGSLVTVLLVGLAMGKVSPSSDVEAAAFAAGVFIPLFIAVDLAHRAAERHRGTGYDVVEPVQIASDDAYDYADGLEDDRTLIEDKRDAECYLAEPRGDGDA